MIILVCGGRNFGDYRFLTEAMDYVTGQVLREPVDLLVHGGARGADSLAELWAHERGIHTAQVPALWTFYGKPAGTLRNQAMLALKPDYFVAFPGGSGTADMVRRLHGEGVSGWRYD